MHKDISSYIKVSMRIYLCIKVFSIQSLARLVCLRGRSAHYANLLNNKFNHFNNKRHNGEKNEMKYLENSNLETLGEILSTSEDNLDGRLEARIESYR